jgi:integrase
MSTGESKGSNKGKRRRRKGEGSIYQRKDGRWVATLTLQDKDGMSRPVTRYAHSYREAREKLSDLQRDRDMGISSAADNLTVERYLLQWLDTYARPNLRYTTVRAYESHIRNHLIPEFGDKLPLRSLSPDHVQRLLNKMVSSGRAPMTVRHVLAVLKRALRQAERSRLIYYNPASQVTPPKIPRSKGQAFTEEQIYIFLTYCRRNDARYPLYLLCLSTGLRIGEALALRWSDIDFNNRLLRVRSSLQPTGESSRERVEPKTPYSYRTVPLPAALISVLLEHEASQRLQRGAAGDEWRNLDYIFTTRTGGPLGHNNVGKAFRRSITRCGLPHLRIHDMRHTYASLLLSKGVDIKTVSDMLGHSTIRITFDLYAHTYEGRLGEVGDVMDNFLQGGDAGEEEGEEEGDKSS